MAQQNMNISFSPPDISELEIQEVAQALRSGWITTGPRTKQLENTVTSNAFVILLPRLLKTIILRANTVRRIRVKHIHNRWKL